MISASALALVVIIFLVDAVGVKEDNIIHKLLRKGWCILGGVCVQY